MNAEEYLKKIELIDWQNYQSAYGDASNIPHELKRLISDNQTEIVDAAHQLWSSLCHQHAYISSAAEPAYPFLLHVLRKAEGAVLVEILDIFAGFAECSSPNHPEGDGVFQQRIRSLLMEDIDLFKMLSVVEGAEGFAEGIVGELENNA